MRLAGCAGRSGPRLVLERYLEPLAPYLSDQSLTEIVVNRPGEIFVEGPGGWARHEADAENAIARAESILGTRESRGLFGRSGWNLEGRPTDD